MAHLQVWIKEDQGEELPQTQKNIEVVRQRLERNGAVNNHNVRMYVPANQPQYCHYSVNDSRPKLTLWLGLCGNGDMFLPRRKP